MYFGHYEEALKAMSMQNPGATGPSGPDPIRDEPMLQFFAYGHLPPNMQAISRPFGELAHWMVVNLPRNPERTAGLRKLLEAKDCAVRSHIYKD